MMLLAGTEHPVLEDIGSGLSGLFATHVVRSPSSISVRASDPSGFDMTMFVDDGRYVLAFDEWTEESEDADRARALFAAALQGHARLKVEYLSGRPWRWTLERLDAGRWMPESTMAHAIWRFWGRSSVGYLRNSFAVAPEARQAPATVQRLHSVAAAGVS